MDNKRRIALFIDYDNFNQAEHFPILFDELNELGDILIKHAFFSNFKDEKMKDKFIKFGIEPQSQIAYTPGKNALDIRITIDAMKLLNREYIDCICLATNDADFTPLVKELQKSNKYLIGAGHNANETYRNTFNYFINVGQIHEAQKAATAKVKTKTESDKYKAELEKLVKTLTHIVEAESQDGWADFSRVIQLLKNKVKDFNPKNYRAKNKYPLPFIQEQLSDYFLLRNEGTVYQISVKPHKVVKR